MRHHPGGELVAALERAWQAIRESHADLPDVVMVSGAGSDGRSTGLVRLGHFAAGRWQTKHANLSPLAELFVGGEGLGRGAQDVFATLLHEAVHALANARNIKETSRDGRYHNRLFAQLAVELGLQVDRHPVRGFSETQLSPQGERLYRPAIAALDRALTVRRGFEPTGHGKRSRNPLACECACGRRIRVATSVLAAGEISCSLCNSPFEVKPATEAQDRCAATNGA